jgi:hypothetical protein
MSRAWVTHRNEITKSLRFCCATWGQRQPENRNVLSWSVCWGLLDAPSWVKHIPLGDWILFCCFKTPISHETWPWQSSLYLPVCWSTLSTIMTFYLLRTLGDRWGQIKDESVLFKLQSEFRTKPAWKLDFLIFRTWWLLYPHSTKTKCVLWLFWKQRLGAGRCPFGWAPDGTWWQDSCAAFS